MEDNWLDAAIQREALPRALREETVEQFSAKWDIKPGQYYYEVSKKENWAKILEISLNRARVELPEVLESLIKNAKGGKEKSVEMYLDYIIKLAKNLDIKSDGKPLIQIASEVAAKYGITPQNTSHDS